MNPTDERMCAKCGIRPTTTPRASICHECAALGSKAPINPDAVAAAEAYDAKRRYRPKVVTLKAKEPRK